MALVDLFDIFTKYLFILKLNSARELKILQKYVKKIYIIVLYNKILE